MKKVLFTANLDSFFYKFLIPYLKWFKEHGYEVHVATKGNNFKIPYCDKRFDVCFARTPFTFDNIKSYNQLKKILKENKYDIIHCHTPFGGAITRFAAKKARKEGTKVIYTAHGFHFFEGASKKDWLIFYNSEKYLSRLTDVIVTINKSDYEQAKKFYAKKTYLIHGIGADEEKFKIDLTKEEKDKLRKSVKVNKSDFVMMYPAELNNNKNQMMLIDAMKILVEKDKKYKLLLPGQDSLNGKLQERVKELGLEKNIIFLGFRKDISKLLQITDLSVATSKREGLPVNIIEAMYAGLPVVCTNTRGQIDLIKNNVNGFVCESGDYKKFAKCIEKIAKDKNLAKKFSIQNKKDVQKYLLENTLKEMSKIYLEEMKGE